MKAGKPLHKCFEGLVPLHAGQGGALPAHKRQFHALKHSIGTHILDAGEDVYFAKDCLDH